MVQDRCDRRDTFINTDQTLGSGDRFVTYLDIIIKGGQTFGTAVGQVPGFGWIHNARQPYPSFDVDLGSGVNCVAPMTTDLRTFLCCHHLPFRLVHLDEPMIANAAADADD